jgi:hypothetical protein
MINFIYNTTRDWAFCDNSHMTKHFSHTTRNIHFYDENLNDESEIIILWLLVFINAYKKICKRTNIVIAFT